MATFPHGFEGMPFAADTPERNAGGTGVAPKSFLIEGPIAGSYSLSIVNRELGRALVALGHSVRFYQRQGPDLATDPFVAADPVVASRLIDKAELTSADQFDVHSRNDWPMSASPRWGRLVCAHCYGWEESLMPQTHAAELDRLDLIMFTSAFSRDAARASGVACRAGIVGAGVDNFVRIAAAHDPALGKYFEPGHVHVLHVSSGLRRKGMDVGLSAFLAEFGADEKVRLIIKTVWNETNEIFSEYDRLSAAQRKRVRLITDEIDDASLRWLVERAEVVFLPSRGEGFLLPAAEAMAIGKLVVTTRCGGNEAFCTDRTCILIDSEPAASTSHLSTEGSAWFEPDVDSTRRALRRAVEIGNVERTRMTEAAVQGMKAYRWRNVAARVVAECAAALASPARGRATVALVSTFNQHCGIADYSSELVKRFAAEDVDTIIVAEDVEASEKVAADDERVRRVWTRSDDGIEAIVEELLTLPSRCSILVQHHPGILSWQALATIVNGVHRSRAIHVEMHSTVALDAQSAEVKNAIARASGILVHNGRDYGAWLRYLRETALRVVKLPVAGHGSAAEGGTALFSFGICLPHKGFHKIIDYLGVYTTPDSGVTARLVCSVVTARPESVRYANELYNMVRMLGLGDRVELTFDFLPIDRVRAIARECTIGVFAYDDVEEGASSAVRVSLGEGLLTIVSPSRIFDEFEESLVRMPGYDAEALDTALTEVAPRAARKAALATQLALRTFLRPDRHANRILQALDVDRLLPASEDDLVPAEELAAI